MLWWTRSEAVQDKAAIAGRGYLLIKESHEQQNASNLINRVSESLKMMHKRKMSG